MMPQSHPSNQPETPFPASKILMLRKLSIARFVPLAAAILLAVPAAALHAQASDPRAEAAIQASVDAELEAARTDKSNWMYHDRDVSPTRNALYMTIETPQGSLRRLLELNNQPLSPQARSQESDRIARFVNDASAQAHEHKASAHDDAQATEMTTMLPRAFIWTVAQDTPEAITLTYRPNPAFNPPDYEARVMALMAGQVVITHDGNRMKTLRGTLTEEVKFGYGFFGHLNKGGTFDIERRMVGGGHWQITESHVHIGGRALLFKDIGQQDDEVKTDWKPSLARTLQEAEELLRDIR